MIVSTLDHMPFLMKMLFIFPTPKGSSSKEIHHNSKAKFNIRRRHRSSYAGLCPWSLLWSQFLTLPVSLTNKSLAFISTVKPMFPPVMPLAPHARLLACVPRGRFFADFAKTFKSGRSEGTKREISRKNGDSSVRVSVVFFSKIAASINDVVWLKYRVFKEK